MAEATSSEGSPPSDLPDMQIMHLQIHHMFTMDCKSVHTHVQVHTPTRMYSH